MGVKHSGALRDVFFSGKEIGNGMATIGMACHMNPVADLGRGGGIRSQNFRK